MSKTILLSVAAMMAFPAWPQIPLAQAGYSMVEPLEVAPAQLVLISTYGIGRRIGPASVSTPETELDGLRASLHQTGTTPIPVQFLGIRQTGCGPTAPATCEPFTGLTMVMPLAFFAMGTRGELVINDRGTDVRRIPVRFVPDRIHIVSTCDEVAVTVGSDPSRSECGPIVRRALGGQLITPDNPARPGETIVVWAYGLGLPGRPMETEFGQVTPVLSPPSVHFSFGSSTAPALPTRPGNAPAFAAAFPPTGLYQVNITVPTLPEVPGQQDLRCDGQTVTSNLTIMLTGYSSMDAVRICVAP